MEGVGREKHRQQASANGFTGVPHYSQCDIPYDRGRLVR